MTEWISIKDRLPEQFERILIYIPKYLSQKDFMAVSIFMDKGQFQEETHWMPLPEKPHEMD